MDSKWKFHNIYQRMWEKRGMTEDQVNNYNYISLLNWLAYFFEQDKVIAARQNS